MTIKTHGGEKKRHKSTEPESRPTAKIFRRASSKLCDPFTMVFAHCTRTGYSEATYLTKIHWLCHILAWATVVEIFSHRTFKRVECKNLGLNRGRVLTRRGHISKRQQVNIHRYPWNGCLSNQNWKKGMAILLCWNANFANSCVTSIRGNVI